MYSYQGLLDALWHLLSVPRLTAWLALSSLMVYATMVSILRRHGARDGSSLLNQLALEKTLMNLLTQLMLLFLVLDTPRFLRFRQPAVVLVFVTTTLISSLLRGMAFLVQEHVERLAACGGLGSEGQSHQRMVAWAVGIICIMQGALGCAFQSYLGRGDQRPLQLLCLLMYEGSVVLIEALLSVVRLSLLHTDIL